MCVAAILCFKQGGWRLPEAVETHRVRVRNYPVSQWNDTLAWFCYVFVPVKWPVFRAPILAVTCHELGAHNMTSACVALLTPVLPLGHNFVERFFGITHMWEQPSFGEQSYELLKTQSSSLNITQNT